MTVLPDWREFIELLNSRGVEHVIVGAWARRFLKPGHIIQLGIDPYRIDLITGITGVSFDEAWNARVTGEIDGVPTAFLSLRLFRKQASGRP